MLPNIRLSGASNSPIDSIGDFLGVSTAAAARSAAVAVATNNSDNKNTNAANRLSAAVAAQNAVSSGWGAPLVTTASVGGTKTLADYVKESAWQSSLSQQQQTNATSMPWSAAVKAPSEQHASSTSAATANAFDCNSTIGSWSSPENSSSNRGGWNADGSSKGDGVLDDGTAIWGNPSTKKTGIDWTEKESLLNPPQTNNNSEKQRIQKPEPTISSINGTEAWGAPAGGAALKPSNNSQQQSKLNDNSGNTYGSKSANVTLSWGESSSLQSATKNENSSPPNNSVWNTSATSNHANNIGKQQRSSDWLASSSSSSGANSRAIDELNKQFEATSLFDTISSSTLAKNSSPPSSSNNPNLDNQSSTIGINLANNAIGTGPGTIGGGLGGNSAINDLKQMSANFSNDLLDSPNRQSASAVSASNNPQSQLNSCAYPLGVTPSRDLLKQMVHQIQLAVQAGHLNAHILNQPMSTPTLQLVYTLLQQIKLLHQFQEIQQRSVNKSTDMNSPSNLELQINRVQQNISLLQKAITQQQAALTKNQTLVGSNMKQQQQAANNYSYATISKLSTNSKVPLNNMSNIINNSNIDSFRRGSLIDTLSNSNSDSLRSAQATFDANAAIDKTLSPLLQASSSGNNILGKGDFTKAQCFTSGDANQQQAPKSSLLSAQATSSSAWLAFNSSDFVSQGWPRISSNVSQQDQQFNADLVSEFGNGKTWRSSSILSSGGKDNPPTSMASGANINLNRPNSASNNMKQMSENDILNRDPSLFYDWSNNTCDSNKRNFDAAATSSFSPSAIGGLSLQSNPWLFAPTSSSLNIGSGIDSLIGKSSGSNSSGNKLDNGNTDKMAGDSLSFLRSNNPGNIQRSSSALYDWGELPSSSLQFNIDDNLIGNKKGTPSSGGGGSSSGSIGGGSRPGPPPGLMNNFGSLIGNSGSVNGISGHSNNKIGMSNDEGQLPSRESSSSLWSGAWFD